MGNIQKGDPNAVRIGVTIVGCGALLGVVLILMAGRLRPVFETWVKEDVDARLPLVIAAMMLLTTGPLLAMSGYLWHLGRRIVSAERYPPPRLRMLGDAPVVTGDVAVRRGRLVQSLAVIMAVAGLVLALLLTRLLFLSASRAA